MPDNDGSGEEWPVLRLRKNSTPVRVGNPAVLVVTAEDPWLCVPRFRAVCLDRERLFISRLLF